MTTREEALAYGLSFPDTYQEAPFHDENWQLAGDRKMASAVGNALHKNPDPSGIPCYRVVNSKGELAGEFAFGGAWKQAEMLMADGIEVVNGRVDLDKYGMKI